MNSHIKKDKISKKKKDDKLDKNKISKNLLNENKNKSKNKLHKKTKPKTCYNPFDSDEIMKNNFIRKNLKYVLNISMDFLNLKKAY